MCSFQYRIESRCGHNNTEEEAFATVLSKNLRLFQTTVKCRTLIASKFPQFLVIWLLQGALPIFTTRNISLSITVQKVIQSTICSLSITREKSPNKLRPRASSLEPGTLYNCAECRYMSTSKHRYERHFKQPRHVNSFRDRAYKGSNTLSD